ncbi:unnamed protein product [Ambrosiozyma monospora]|uniref:Unnamed protein product n=1 Tax=Ambrosiozyma monospora TaxID=43982 RepID=A0ACB5T8P5_AMBMO|nr:unnamed protein product [Ambrosiozyma monospora]
MSASPPPVYSHLERVKTTNLHARNTPEPPAVPLDPVTAGNNLIDQINTEFKEDYEVPLNKFFNTVDLRYAELKGEQEEVGPDGEKKAGTITRESTPKSPRGKGSYKEKLGYQYLFYNEHLLAMLMKLDTVESQGDEKLRIRRKETIKFVQGYCKKLDACNAKVKELSKAGIEF